MVVLSHHPAHQMPSQGSDEEDEEEREGTKKVETEEEEDAEEMGMKVEEETGEGPIDSDKTGGIYGSIPRSFTRIFCCRADCARNRCLLASASNLEEF